MRFLFLFEVLDKEPSLSIIWGIFLLIGGVGLLLSRLSSLLVFIPITGTLLFAQILLSEFHDPHINKSIWAEDSTYLPQTYLAIFMSILLPIVGAVWNVFSKRKYIK